MAETTVVDLGRQVISSIVPKCVDTPHVANEVIIDCNTHNLNLLLSGYTMYGDLL